MGRVLTIPSSKIKFEYRNCDLERNLIFLSASFKGKLKGKDLIKKDIEILKAKKEKTQPTKIKTSGSTFKNPTNDKKAWELIKLSECSGLKVGGASISEKHNNFFLNNGNASSSDIESLIHKVKEKVFKKTGIDLELEIKIIGKK